MKKSQQRTRNLVRGFFILCIAVISAKAGIRTERPAAGQTAQQILGRELEPGQAVIWYLYHSGRAVKTRNHFLIFDYTEPSERPAKRSLDSGSIDRAEIRGQNVTTFVSHGHADHFDPLILEWRTVIKSIRYVWGREERARRRTFILDLSGRQ